MVTRGTGDISTRRFFARLPASALGVTGCCEPNAAENTEEGGMPASIRVRVTVSARTLAEDAVELKRRAGGEPWRVSLGELLQQCKEG